MSAGTEGKKETLSLFQDYIEITESARRRRTEDEDGDSIKDGSNVCHNPHDCSQLKIS